MPSPQDLLAIDRGSIVAPAGCGKTELIARAAALHAGKRILILTHTNAGRRALDQRLRRLRVTRGVATVDTIAGWALGYATSYPASTGHGGADPIGAAWEAMYRAVADLLATRALREVLRASYARVFVDEYQDCNTNQHALIHRLADVLPTCVLGDPLQGIFDFGTGIVPWAMVTADFPARGELTEPWRWNGKNAALGRWCLELRAALLAGEAIDLKKAPIHWSEAKQSAQVGEAFRMSRLTGSVVVIRKWEAQAHKFARSLNGNYRSMEEVEGKSLRDFAIAMDELEGPERADAIVELAADCMIGLKAKISTAAKALADGKVPTAKQSKNQPEVVAALIAACRDPSPTAAHAAMAALEGIPGCPRFRSELWSSAKKVLREHPAGRHASIAAAAAALRQQQRAVGAAIDPRVVSRTLLIKGLEFDHALIPSAEEFETKQAGEGARHFYVAATRASHTLSVLSATPVVRFAAPAP